jgi:DGQHR domain-containing protein
MKFFFADTMDTVDPNYDFVANYRSPGRDRNKDGAYPHELLASPPYDGMLISRAAVGEAGRTHHYSQGQRFRLTREGAREFLRFPYKGYNGSPEDYPIMGDCGSFSYINLEKPLYGVEDTIDFYESCGFTHGVSPDHIILDMNPKWDNARLCPEYIASRASYTINSAKIFMNMCKKRRVKFVPVGAVQGWSPKSYAKYANELVEHGYEYLGFGGLTKKTTKAIYDVIAEVRCKISSSIKIHIFGFNRFKDLERFNGLNITSFDSTSPLMRAFKDKIDNYFVPEGKHYSAFKVRQLHERKLKKRIQSGDINMEVVAKHNRVCHENLRAYAQGDASLEVVLDSLCNYEKHISPNVNNREDYRRTLLGKPWEKCPCKICKNIGIDVMIFGGLNRNKRRGFHNLYVFHEKLKGVRKMKVIRVPCIKTRQNNENNIFSFVANGKDISKFASISRIKRENMKLVGYQRPEIEEHINDIKSYLERRDAMLLNSLVIAFNKKLNFIENGICPHGTLGTLEIPVGGEEKVGWIVDGQQRAAALRGLNRDIFPVPVVGFESKGDKEEREQFVFVNNTRPLPKSLVYELLPSIGTSVPPKLKKRQKAYRLLERLNLDQDSPLYTRIKTITSRHLVTANIKDLSVLKMIENSMENGILNKYNDGVEEPLKILKNYWSAVKEYYDLAWSMPPKQSRLTHGAGIISMGYIMDSISFRLSEHWSVVPKQTFLKELDLLGREIPWTEGRWVFSNDMVLPWNEIQNTNKHIDLVANYLIRKYKSNCKLVNQ